MIENRVKEFREKKEMTQRELCERAGISRATLCKIEGNTAKNIKTSTAANIARALGEQANIIFLI